jgi:O-antigen/teichoic acid export membrane protein
MYQLLKIFKGSLLMVIAINLPQLINFFLLPITSKYLTKSDFGIFGTIMAFNGLIIVFQNLGIDMLLVSSFYKKNKLRTLLWNRYLGICFIWKHIFLIIHYLIIYSLIPENDIFSRFSVTLLIVAPSYFFSITNTFTSRYLILSKRVNTIFFCSIVSSIFAGLVNYYCIVILSYGYVGWLFSNIISSLILFIPQSYILYYKLNFHPSFNMKRKWMLKSLKKSLYALPHYYSNFLLDASDRVVMKWYDISFINIGAYNISYLFGNLINRLIIGIGMVVNPYILEYYKLNRREHDIAARNILVLIIGGIICLLFIVALFSNEIVLFFFNDLYSTDIVELSILIIMSYSFRALFWVPTNRLFLDEKVENLWKISTVGGLINIVLNIILIPIFGYKIAAYTTFLSMAYFGVFGFYLSEYKKVKMVEFYPLFWMFLIIFLTVILNVLQFYNILIKIALSTSLILINIIIFVKFDFRIVFKNKNSLKI